MLDQQDMGLTGVTANDGQEFAKEVVACRAMAIRVDHQFLRYRLAQMERAAHLWSGRDQTWDHDGAGRGGEAEDTRGHIERDSIRTRTQMSHVAAFYCHCQDPSRLQVLERGPELGQVEDDAPIRPPGRCGQSIDESPDERAPRKRADSHPGRWQAARPQPVNDQNRRTEMQQSQGDRSASGEVVFQSLETFATAMVRPSSLDEPIRPEAQQPREIHASSLYP